MSLEFEWDPRKAGSNSRKHKVSFEEAVSVFADPLSSTISDPVHSHDEDRYAMIGSSPKGRLLVVVFTERGGRIRIISARRATARERKDYEEGT
jgi:uncharacterized protein